MKRVVSALALIGCAYGSLPASAALLSSKPEVVCHWLDPVYLPSHNAWTHFPWGKTGCASDLRQLDGSPLPNVIAYYAEGDAKSATKVQVELSVHDTNAIQNAHQEMLRAADLLIVKSTGKRMPKIIEKAILADSNAHARVGKGTVTVIFKPWPTHRGYDVDVDVQ
jgi:hypothetical protein